MKITQKRYAVKPVSDDNLVWNIPRDVWNHVDKFSIVDNSTWDENFAKGQMLEQASRHDINNKYSAVPIDVQIVELEVSEK